MPRNEGVCSILTNETSNPWAPARRVMGAETLSVVLPVYNLSGKIAANLRAVDAVLARGGFAYELLPVDDGSADGTAMELRALDLPSVRPVFVERNAGKGHALKAGFAASRGAFVLLLDGDLDIMPQWLPFFFESMETHRSDVVVGSKRHPASRVRYPWHRRLASSVYHCFVRLSIGLPVTDSQTGMKLFRRKILGDALARMLVKTYAFDLELLAIAFGRGAKISEAPVEIRFGEKLGALKFRTVRDMVRDTLAVFYRLRVLNYYAKVEVPPPLAEPPFVSVIIACPKSGAWLDECLRALARQTYRRFETIVLPDGDPPPGAAEGTPAGESVRWIATGKVRPAEKRNRGIAAARGSLVAFIDDDAYPDERWLANAVKYFSVPDIGALGGPGVTPPGDGFLARCGGRVYENVFVSGNFRYRYLGGRVRRDIDDYPSCNLFVRKDVLDAIGGYRTDFWPGEDTLLCDDIVYGQHKRIVYDPWTIVYHHRRPLFLPHLRQLGRYAFHRGYFVKRFPATSAKFSYFVPTLFVAYLLAFAGFCLVRHFAGGGAWGPVAATLGAPLVFYVLLTAASSFSFNPARWAFVELGVFLSHAWYGVQFARGLCAGRAPCEFLDRKKG